MRAEHPAVVLVRYVESFGDCAKGEVQRLPWSIARELCLAGKAVVISDQRTGRCVLAVPKEN